MPLRKACNPWGDAFLKEHIRGQQSIPNYSFRARNRARNKASYSSEKSIAKAAIRTKDSFRERS